jgi:hypothetical protein
MVYSRGQMNENQRICDKPMGCESCASRGLAREAFGCVDLIRGMFQGFWDSCHAPFPGVEAVFCFLEVLLGRPLPLPPSLPPLNSH